uniref:J domain-containing protein n=1 Tax=viral metagenome TaxID=1070528 RepID=A0A6C0IVW6_9ZZZZ
MNNIYFSSSFNTYNNGKHTKNEEKLLNYSDGIGEYSESQFGKIVKKQKITKEEIDRYLRHSRLTISDKIFNDALNIISNNSIDTNLFEIPIYEGLKHNNYKKLNFIDNSQKKTPRAKKCNLIENKYKLQDMNKKNQMKKIYKSRSLKIHPDKCKTKQCEEDFKDLSLDYHNYFDTDNNC